MIVRVSSLIVASVAAFAISQININSSRNSKRNKAIKPSENDDSRFQQKGIKGEEEEKFADSNVSDEEKQEEEVSKKCGSNVKQDTKQNSHEKRELENFEFPTHGKKLNYVTETELLQKLVKELDQRKVTHKGKLLELCGLQEQQSCIAQLQRHLEAKTAEINMLNMTIDLLQTERKGLHEEIKQNLLAEKQLEMPKKRIKEMQAKMDTNANQMKGQLMMLKEQVLGFQRKETTPIREAMVAKKFKAVKDVELEVGEMKRRNKELQLEKRELTVKLVAAKARITELSNKAESKISAKVGEEISSLRQGNEYLSKQVEALQKSRFGMVEELVYQRWLNACLKFEIQDYQTPIRKPSKHNLSKTLGQSSCEKPEQLMLDHSLDTNSSHTSSAESDETDSNTFDSSSSRQKSIRKKYSLIHKIKSWGISKDDSISPGRSSTGNSLSKTGLVRRFSMSMVPSSTSMTRNKYDSAISSTSFRDKEAQDSLESPKTPTFPRNRRVSFSDSVKKFPLTFQDMQKSVEGELDDKKMSGERSGHGSTMHASYKHVAELEGEKQEASALELTSIKAVQSSDSSVEAVNNDRDSTMHASYKHVAELEGEKQEASALELTSIKAVQSSDSSVEAINNDRDENQRVNEVKVLNTEELHSRIPTVLPNDNKVGTRMVHLITVFFFFLVMSLVYFFLHNARIY
ncbi:hypothetical protein L1049_016257 [Liquidambar formosana]|uniref:Protein CHUP1, chloroplastic n=1 Tax=Liquidambar formosana TaxID=63359 RepID=A0AAP0X7C0_LIQFO